MKIKSKFLIMVTLDESWYENLDKKLILRRNIQVWLNKKT